MVKNQISEEKIQHYFDVTLKAINKVKLAGFDESRIEQALDFLDMAERYFKDANFFYSKGDIVNAFAAVNYAHGWLDAGARIGLFKVKDSKLFTVDEE